VRLDRKLLLIAPAIVLACVAAAMVYATVQLHILEQISDSWKDRSDFIAAVDRGEKKLEQRQAIGILRLSLDVEAKRTVAIGAMRDLMIVLSAVAVVSCCVLAIGIRSVPRQHWPRFGARDDTSA
jgi:glutamate formiminotransferase